MGIGLAPLIYNPNQGLCAGFPPSFTPIASPTFGPSSMPVHPFLIGGPARCYGQLLLRARPD